MLIKNVELKNQKISTTGGVFTFDDKGVADIPDDIAKQLLTIKGFSQQKIGATRQPITAEKDKKD